MYFKVHILYLAHRYFEKFFYQENRKKRLLFIPCLFKFEKREIMQKIIFNFCFQFRI